MTGRSIDMQLKMRIVSLLLRGTPLDVLAIVFDVSERSIWRWKARFLQEGVLYKPITEAVGRPSMLSMEARDAVCELLIDDPTLYIDEISEWIELAFDLRIPDSTLNHILVQLQMTRKHLSRAASERDEQDRADWKAYHEANLRTHQLVFIDESGKDDRTVFRKYGRSMQGTRAKVSQPFAHGDRWSILPALTEDGYIATRIVPDSVDGVEFLDFVMEDVV